MEKIKNFFKASLPRFYFILASIFLILYFTVIQPASKDNKNLNNKVPIGNEQTIIKENQADSPKVNKTPRQIHQLEEKSVDSSESKDELLRRQIMEECLTALNYVVKKSGIEEAREIAAFIKNNSALARVDQDSLIFIDKPIGDSIAIVVLLRSDVLGLQWMKHEMDHAGISRFSAQRNCIVIEAEDLGGKIVNGLMMLFQGSKANVEDYRKYDKLHNINHRSFEIASDLRAYVLLSKVLTALGSTEYDLLLEKEIKRMEVRYYEANVFSFKPVDTLVFPIFTAITPLEENFISKCFLAQASMKMVDRDTSLSKEQVLYGKQLAIENLHFNRK